MATREVTVEVTAKYITKVIADNGKEAQKNAKNMILLGIVSPYEMNAIILDVQPINDKKTNNTKLMTKT